MKTNSVQQTLQESISKGNHVVIQKENAKSFVQIRFNNKDIDGTKKWRVIIDSVEYLVSEIEILTHSRTQSDFFEDLQEYKHHIVVDAQKIVFNNNISTIF